MSPTLGPTGARVVVEPFPWACDARHMPMEVTIMKMNPKMDIIALALATGDVVLHRVVNWQRLWTVQKCKQLKPFGGDRSKDKQANVIKVIDIEWSPDGTVIAIAYDGYLELDKQQYPNTLLASFGGNHLSAPSTSAAYTKWDIDAANTVGSALVLVDIIGQRQIRAVNSDQVITNLRWRVYGSGRGGGVGGGSSTTTTTNTNATTTANTDTTTTFNDDELASLPWDTLLVPYLELFTEDDEEFVHFLPGPIGQYYDFLARCTTRHIPSSALSDGKLINGKSGVSSGTGGGIGGTATGGNRRTGRGGAGGGGGGGQTRGGAGGQRGSAGDTSASNSHHHHHHHHHLPMHNALEDGPRLSDYYRVHSLMGTGCASSGSVGGGSVGNSNNSNTTAATSGSITTSYTTTSKVVKRFNVLLVGTTLGIIDCYPMGLYRMLRYKPGRKDNATHSIKQVWIDAPLSMLYSIEHSPQAKMDDTIDIANDNMHTSITETTTCQLSLTHTRLLAYKWREAYIFTRLKAQLDIHLEYLYDSVCAISTTWDDVLAQLDSKLSNYDLTTSSSTTRTDTKNRLSNTITSGGSNFNTHDNSNSHRHSSTTKIRLTPLDFINLLFVGHVSMSLEKFLVDVTHQDLQQLHQSLEINFAKIHSLNVNKLQIGLYRVLALLNTITALSLHDVQFGDFFSTTRVNHHRQIYTFVRETLAMLSKTSTLQRALNDSLRKTLALIRSLRKCIVHYIDADTNPGLTPGTVLTPAPTTLITAGGAGGGNPNIITGGTGGGAGDPHQTFPSTASSSSTAGATSTTPAVTMITECGEQASQQDMSLIMDLLQENSISGGFKFEHISYMFAKKPSTRTNGSSGHHYWDDDFDQDTTLGSSVNNFHHHLSSSTVQRCRLAAKQQRDRLLMELNHDGDTDDFDDEKFDYFDDDFNEYNHDELKHKLGLEEKKNINESYQHNQNSNKRSSVNTNHYSPYGDYVMRTRLKHFTRKLINYLSTSTKDDSISDSIEVRTSKMLNTFFPDLFDVNSDDHYDDDGHVDIMIDDRKQSSTAKHYNATLNDDLYHFEQSLFNTSSDIDRFDDQCFDHFSLFEHCHRLYQCFSRTFGDTSVDDPLLVEIAHDGDGEAENTKLKRTEDVSVVSYINRCMLRNKNHRQQCAMVQFTNDHHGQHHQSTAPPLGVCDIFHLNGGKFYLALVGNLSLLTTDDQKFMSQYYQSILNIGWFRSSLITPPSPVSPTTMGLSADYYRIIFYADIGNDNPLFAQSFIDGYYHSSPLIPLHIEQCQFYNEEFITLVVSFLVPLNGTSSSNLPTVAATGDDDVKGDSNHDQSAMDFTMDDSTAAEEVVLDGNQSLSSLSSSSITYRRYHYMVRLAYCTVFDQLRQKHDDTNMIVEGKGEDKSKKDDETKDVEVEEEQWHFIPIPNAHLLGIVGSGGSATTTTVSNVTAAVDEQTQLHQQQHPENDSEVHKNYNDDGDYDQDMSKLTNQSSPPLDESAIPLVMGVSRLKRTQTVTNVTSSTTSSDIATMILDCNVHRVPLTLETASRISRQPMTTATNTNDTCIQLAPTDCVWQHLAVDAPNVKCFTLNDLTSSTLTSTAQQQQQQSPQPSSSLSQSLLSVTAQRRLACVMQRCKNGSLFSVLDLAEYNDEDEVGEEETEEMVIEEDDEPVVVVKMD